MPGPCYNEYMTKEEFDRLTADLAPSQPHRTQRPRPRLEAERREAHQALLEHARETLRDHVIEGFPFPANLDGERLV